MKQKGFTLLEVMIVMVIISIISSIAIPKYNNYIIKSKINSAFITLKSLVTPYEFWVEENHQNKETTQPTPADLNLESTDSGTVNINENKLSIILKNTNPAIHGKEITLDKKNNTWVCSSTLPEEYKPNQCKEKTNE